MRINRSRIAGNNDREIINRLGVAREQAVRLDVVGEVDSTTDDDGIGAHVNGVHWSDLIVGIVNANFAGIDDGNRAVKGQIQRGVVTNAGGSVGGAKGGCGEGG